MSERPPVRPLAPYGPWVAAAVAAALAFALLPWDLSHLGTAEGWAAAWTRLDAFFAAFAPPDLSARTLGLAADLALETLAIAVLGVSLGLVLAYPIALLASAATLDDGARRPTAR